MAADLELYKVFAAVAEAGSVSGGAARLFITQPAASQAVKKLEQQVGVRLFTRGKRGVTLTQEGQLPRPWRPWRPVSSSCAGYRA